MLLVLNAGSSSLKFALFDDPADAGRDPQLQRRGQIEGLLTAPHFVARDGKGATVDEKRWPAGEALGHDAATAFLLDWIGRGQRLRACGHRVVHGGRDFVRPVRVDDAILARLDALSPLAPLHQPHNLAPIRAIARAMPGMVQVACFDTAFHRTQPWEAETFAIPRKLTAEGIIRYGFHGLSYEYVAATMAALDPTARRVVVAHLGNGASLCAIDAGLSVATTMGFTPIDGVPMGTRSGALDPGVILHLINRAGLSGPAVEHMLLHESGLLGVSGISSDMRRLRAEAAPAASEAIRLFTYRIVQAIGALAASLQGIDALVFTAGIGENDTRLRADICSALSWLGLKLDAAANEAGAGGALGKRITAAGRVTAWIVPTNEELMIARHARSLLVA